MSTPQLNWQVVFRFHIPDMDCATEEQLIRNGLRGVAGISALDFDLLARLHGQPQLPATGAHRLGHRTRRAARGT